MAAKMGNTPSWWSAITSYQRLETSLSWSKEAPSIPSLVGLLPWWHPHWPIFSSCLSDYHPACCSVLFHRSELFLHTQATPWPALLFLPLLKHLCLSITALHPHNSPTKSQLFQQYRSSVTAHTDLVPPTWSITSHGTMFLLESTLQFTSSVIFYWVSL